MGKKTNRPPTLDLHGKTTDKVFDLVDQFIMKHQNKARVCIIPGKGSGAVKKELLKYLKLGGYPWEYETLANGGKNTGSLVVHIG